MKLPLGSECQVWVNFGEPRWIDARVIEVQGDDSAAVQVISDPGNGPVYVNPDVKGSQNRSAPAWVGIRKRPELGEGDAGAPFVDSAARIGDGTRLDFEPDEWLQVWALSPGAALAFFGFSSRSHTVTVLKQKPTTAREIERYRPEASLYGIKAIPAVPGAHAHADAKKKCPRCDSPDPARHPAVQYGGEVHICSHPFHASTERGREVLAAATRKA